jgi:hypothetical protein
MEGVFPILGAVLTASVLGSTHCAGMYGAFALIAVSDGCERPSGVARIALAASYNAGRGITYVLFGAVAGLVGRALDMGGAIVGVQRVALVLCASIMLVIALLRIARELGVLAPAWGSPRWMVAGSRWAHQRAFAFPPAARALAVGLLTTLLPCGWLYTFVVAAAATASPLHGALVMATFWLGTLPMMAALGLGARAVLGRLGPRSGLLAGVLLAAAALWTLASRPQLSSVVTIAGVPEARVLQASELSRSTPACHAPGASVLGATSPSATKDGAP